MAEKNRNYILSWAIANAAIRKYGGEIDKFLFKLSGYKCKIDKRKIDSMNAPIMKGKTLNMLLTYSKPERERVLRNMIYHLSELNLLLSLNKS